jgi:hypothetical protein
MIGDSGAAAVAEIEPVAGFARPDLQSAKRLKNGRPAPYVAKSLTGHRTGSKVRFLKECTGIDASFGGYAAGQFAGTAHIQSK